MPTKPLRLLAVDDEEVWRDILRRVLGTREDIEFSEADSGRATLDMVQSRDYDLILLDMRLPSGTEGLDVLQQIKQIRPKTAVIMMSAYVDVPRTVEAMTRGARDFVPKEMAFSDIVTLKVNEFLATESLIIDRERLIASKYNDSLRLEDPNAKGKALEDLLAAIISSVEGLNLYDRNVNTETEEIDLFFTNGSRDPLWQRESGLVLVECKNWHKQRVGKDEFVLFKAKIENRAGRCRLGFLVCTGKFAETVTKEMLRSSRTDVLVVPIDGEGLLKLIEADDRSKCLYDFLLAATSV
jgi:DNA-binding NarL/FixJ family response regulator